MGYMHIDNLYKNGDILLFKECYAMEKIHGTSAHIGWHDGKLSLFSGGAAHAEFCSLFNLEPVKEKFREFVYKKIIIYGEAYGGKLQGMKETYGDKLKFVAFDIMIDEHWLNVPNAKDVAIEFGLEFVHYDEVEVDIDKLDALASADSVQAIRNGMGPGHIREGIVLRPLIELVRNSGGRIIVKHKNEKFAERMHQPKVKKVETDKLEIMTKAKEIVDEFVVPMRLQHVLDKFPDASIEDTGEIIKAMIEDICREAEGEILVKKEVASAVGRKTALLFKKFLSDKLKGDL